MSRELFPLRLTREPHGAWYLYGPKHDFGWLPLNILFSSYWYWVITEASIENTIKIKGCLDGTCQVSLQLKILSSDLNPKFLIWLCSTGKWAGYMDSNKDFLRTEYEFTRTMKILLYSCWAILVLLKSSQYFFKK